MLCPISTHIKKNKKVIRPIINEHLQWEWIKKELWHYQFLERITKIKFVFRQIKFEFIEALFQKMRFPKKRIQPQIL